jgi:hydrogenase/urease accessory protein HupE
MMVRVHAAGAWESGCPPLGKVCLLSLLVLLPLFYTGAVQAHALAPSLLQLEAAADGTYAVKWKTPLQRVEGSRLSPVLPAHCRQLEGGSSRPEGTALVSRWRVDCGDRGLVGSSVQISGIASSRADALLRIKLDDGRTLNQVLRPDQDTYLVPARQPWYRVFGSYMVMGFEHLVGGPDHVLFVIALFMLVGLQRSLVWTVTMFTLGHSVTLSLAVLKIITFSQGMAEIFIALSIIVAFTEVLRHPDHDLGNWKVYLMAAGFGLLHGLGFAGALREVGLPADDIPLALLGFNVGIEVGQLALIGVLCLLSLALLRLGASWRGLWKQLPVYAAGSVAGFWFWQRVMLYLV